MASEPIQSIANLKARFQEMPGIGPRNAERLAFHVLRQPKEFAVTLAQAILDVKEKVVHCKTCFNLTEADPCAICADPRRDHGEIWVVEQPQDVITLEASGLIRGSYHVLMGHIAPLEGVEPEDLTIDALIERARSGKVREVVLGLNPTLDGDGTALHILSRLRDLDVRVTRPARGLAVGSQIEYATPGMLDAAIRGRAPM